ncbi:MAG: bifunctional methylenetetrahydrofolate dehydrogenase/methenyltetrahydrofolate cyclohydrolase FolD [Chlamydiales bacterium]
MIIDGQKISREICKNIQKKISAFQGRPPCLAVIMAGDNPASALYVRRKVAACQEVGITSLKKIFPSQVTEEELIGAVDLFNANHAVDGILVQLPLPEHINTTKVITAIDPEKDVDGFHPQNVGKLMMGATDGFVSCTPLGISILLQRTGADLKGKHAVILGRSNVVGKPLAALLMQRSRGYDLTVTIVNRHLQDIATICRQGDIVISAVGIPHIIESNMVKEGAIVIDVGINRIPDPNRPTKHLIVGDVDFEQVKEKTSMITPVPGGVGPMTIAMLLHNTVLSYEWRLGLSL